MNSKDSLNTVVGITKFTSNRVQAAPQVTVREDQGLTVTRVADFTDREIQSMQFSEYSRYYVSFAFLTVCASILVYCMIASMSQPGIVPVILVGACVVASLVFLMNTVLRVVDVSVSTRKLRHRYRKPRLMISMRSLDDFVDEMNSNTLRTLGDWNHIDAFLSIRYGVQEAFMNPKYQEQVRGCIVELITLAEDFREYEDKCDEVMVWIFRLYDVSEQALDEDTNKSLVGGGQSV